MNSPVYTIKNECQDCYKCIRHCPVKAIKIESGNASVIPESCISCGECVKVCPVHAKKIRSDLARLRTLLASDAKVYASIAPSYVGYFKGIGLERLASALMELGFAGVSETAHGAEAVSSHVLRLFKEAPDLKVMISSACPACVDYIRMYQPEWAPYIAPLPSPVRAHAKLLREWHGQDIKVVFIGPCAAKKNEADRNPSELSLAITFPSLGRLFEEHGIDLAKWKNESDLELGPASEGRFYSVEGGMNDTLRDGSSNVRLVSVSGIDNLRRLLSTPPTKSEVTRPIFIEALACAGGCVNGPATSDGAALDTIFATDALSPLQHSTAASHCGVANYPVNAVPISEHSESEIAAALERVGKQSKADEVNCGSCGYETCRAFACAMLDGKAEEGMCHTYLKHNFERTSNALIKYIPAGVVIVDGTGSIIEANRHFAELVGATGEFDALGSLDGLMINNLIPEFASLFNGALHHGSEIEKFRQPLHDRLVNISVFPIATGESCGAVIQDVTRNELHREQIVAKAREVIQKNVTTVQQVARLFGEHIAETEIMLNEIAGSYESHTTPVSYNSGDSDAYLNG